MAPIQRSVDSIDDLETNQLIQELAQISGVQKTSFQGRMLLHFLQQAISPNGAGQKAVPITRKDLDACDVTDSFILRKKVGKTGNDLHSVCASLARLKDQHVDEYHGTSLYVFLSKIVIAKSPSPKKQRWL